jgi:hypothetical protein
MAASDQAFVIGVRTYPEMGSLRGPCRDAQDFYDWLIDPDGGDVPEENVELLVTDSFPHPDVTTHPWVDEIEQLFYPLAKRGVAAINQDESLGRRLYIYMAGHGFGETGNMNEVALYSANAGPLIAPNVAATRWAEWFRRNGVFDEIVLIMDCCRTTSPVATMASPPLPKTNGSPRRTKVKKFYAYATCDGQPAREREGPDGEWAGVFTKALLESFDMAVADARGRVHGGALADYVHQKIGEIQPPDFDSPPRHDIVFAQREKVARRQVPIRLVPFAGGETVVVLDHERNVEAKVDAADEVVEVPLKAGLYKAVVQGTDRSTLFEVPSDEVVV